jgi:hypothetical protein
MNPKPMLALGATLAVLIAPSAAFAAGAPKVTVRIEGKTHTLLGPRTAQTRAGSITMGGAPAGACPATSAAGALDIATHHRWGGKFASGLGLEITSILGERHVFSSPYFWEIFVDNVAASIGACGIKPHRGEQLLFAAVPVQGQAYPTALSAPGYATTGHRFAVKVVSFNAKGKPVPLKGAHVYGAGASAVTGSQGKASIDPSRAGTLVLHAERNGYIRAATVRVRVSG